MNSYTVRQKGIAAIISVALAIFGSLCIYWLWASHWHNLFNAFELRLNAFSQMFKSMTGGDYLWFVAGLIILQEVLMIFCRYCLGLRGKKERIYLIWKGRKMGVHHMHWGALIALIGVVGQLANITTNLLLIALGASFVLGDLMHHWLLFILHGDTDGDGPLQNPFRK